MSIKSDKARHFDRDALSQIPPQRRVQLTGPVRVTLRICYASERPDLDESLLLDVLQARYVVLQLGGMEVRELVQKGVIHNDRQVLEKHVFGNSTARTRASKSSSNRSTRRRDMNLREREIRVAYADQLRNCAKHSC
jgi:hypothetical protein